MPTVAGHQFISSDTATDAGNAVTVGATSSTVVASNPARASITLCNDHATQVIYLKLGAVAAEANKGIRLNAAGGTITLTSYTGEIRAIATGAGTVLCYAEV